RRLASSTRATTRRLRGAPDADTRCHGWVLGFDGAYWARASAAFTHSLGTGFGKKIRVECRSLIALFKASLLATPRFDIKPQFPKGIVSSVSFVSTTNTARSLAGCVSLALALTAWRSPGSPEKLCPVL